MAWQPDYVSATELANYIGIRDAREEARMQLAATTASRAADTHCGRQFGNLGNTVVTRTYRRMVWWDYDLCSWVVPIEDIYDPTGIVVTADGEDISSAVAFGPDNALADGKVYEYLVLPGWADVVSVATSRWGWRNVPTAVRQAVMLQGNHLASRKNAPFGIASGAAGDTRLLNRVDPGLWVSLAGLVRDGIPH